MPLQTPFIWLDFVQWFRRRKRDTRTDAIAISPSLFSSPERKALGELIGWESSRRPSVCVFTLSDMIISETSDQKTCVARIQYTKSKQVLAYAKVGPIYLLSYFCLSVL